MNKLEEFFLKKQLDDEEEVIHIIHKHWIEFIGPLLKWLILGIIIPIFLAWLYPEYYQYLFLCFLFVAIMAIYDFFDWYLDTLILTDYGILHYQWDGFTKNSSSRMEYESIEDISFELVGLMSLMFNFGDLHIERPAGEMIFKNTVNPKKAELKILEARKITRKGFLGSNYGGFGEGEGLDKEGLKSLLGEIIKEHLNENGNNGVRKNGFRRG